MYRCPFPGCDHVAAFAILNSHAETHGYSRVADMTKEHGPVIKTKPDPVKMRNIDSHQLNENSFNNIESALARLKKSDRSELRNRW